MPLFHEFNVLPALMLLLVWAVGGWLIALRLFELGRGERPLVGLGLGMTLSTWLTNFVARGLGIGLAAWISAGVVVAFGLALAFPLLPRMRPPFDVRPGRLLSLIMLALLFTLVGRGLAIFDDYQNLPFLSRIAAGDIPPHFPFDPEIRLGYHYFLLLLAAQWIGAAGALPWAALDLARGVTMALAVLLIGLLAFRLTRKPMAEMAAVGFGALAGGSRWMLLFLPVALAARLSNSIDLLGSGARTGENLSEALLRHWSLNGDGPIPFPFAYASGVYPPRILALSGVGVAPLLIVMLLVLTADRVRSPWGWGVIAILLASLALLSEPTYVLLLVGMLVVVGTRLLLGRSRCRSAVSLWWAAAAVVSVLMAGIQGGMMTEVALRLVNSPAGRGTYYDVTFQLSWPPTVISSHLGDLPLTRFFGLLSAFFEFGPMVLAFPLVIAHGLSAWKEGRQGEAGLVLAGLLSLGMVFVRYAGVAGPTATTRLYGLFGDVCLIYAVPLVWRWLEGRGTTAQAAGALMGLAAVFSGLVLLGIQFVAVPKPVASYFLDDLDAQMFRRHWNTLPSDSMVFDPLPARAVTVFGRAIEAQVDLSGPTDEYRRLAEAPDPSRLRAAGFEFVYADRAYWLRHRHELSAECVVVVDEVLDILSATGEVGDFRRLADLRACR